MMVKTLMRRLSLADDLAILLPAKDKTSTPTSADFFSELKLEVITDIEGMEGIEREWNTLFARSGASNQLFQTFNWNWHWCRTYAYPAKGRRSPAISIVVGRVAGRTVMIWPLIASAKLGFKMICWMGSPVTQYSDVLVEAGPNRVAWLAAGWKFVQDELGAHLICLPKVREDAALMELLGTLDLQPSAQAEAPCADLTDADTYDEYASRFSTRDRKNRRRQRRRLEDHGAVSFEILTGGEQAGAVARHAVSMKRRWLKRKGLVSKAFAGNGIDTFFTNALTSSERPIDGRLVVMKVAGEVAAIELGVVCKDRYASHISAYSLDLQFENSAAGSLAREASIGHCCEDGINQYDLMAPGDAYKFKWADKSVAVFDYVVPLTPVGHVLGTLGSCAHTAMKSVFEAAPHSARRLIASIVGALTVR